MGEPGYVTLMNQRNLYFFPPYVKLYFISYLVFLLFCLELFEQKGRYVDKVIYFCLDQDNSTIFATASFCKVKHCSYFCKIWNVLCHDISTTSGYIRIMIFSPCKEINGRIWRASTRGLNRSGYLWSRLVCRQSWCSVLNTSQSIELL